MASTEVFNGSLDASSPRASALLALTILTSVLLLVGLGVLFVKLRRSSSVVLGDIEAAAGSAEKATQTHKRSPSLDSVSSFEKPPTSPLASPPLSPLSPFPPLTPSPFWPSSPTSPTSPTSPDSSSFVPTPGSFLANPGARPSTSRSIFGRFSSSHSRSSSSSHSRSSSHSKSSSHGKSNEKPTRKRLPRLSQMSKNQLQRMPGYEGGFRAACLKITRARIRMASVSLSRPPLTSSKPSMAEKRGPSPLRVSS